MSGTDYNEQINKIDTAFYNYKQMQSKKISCENIEKEFQKKLISFLGREKYNKIYHSYFDNENFNNYNLTIKYNKQNIFGMQKFLNKYNFIFI